MPKPDPYAAWSLSDRLQMLAFEAELAHLPRSLIGAAYLFPSPMDPARPISKDLAARWLLEAETRAKLPKLRGGTWHPYRRKWATARKALPLVDVAQAGGWRSQETLARCYQQPDEATMFSVVMCGVELREQKA